MIEDCAWLATVYIAKVVVKHVPDPAHAGPRFYADASEYFRSIPHLGTRAPELLFGLGVGIDRRAVHVVILTWRHCDAGG